VDKLKKDISRKARDDKLNQTREELETIEGKDGYKWDGFKRLRNPFNPKRSKFENKQGQYIDETTFAEEAANYLDTSQWSKPTRDEHHCAKHEQYENAHFRPKGEVIDQSSEMGELTAVIGNQKKPGTRWTRG
jgi:hypothetical protein